MNPKRTRADTVKYENPSDDSGIKCRNAEPIKAPAAKAIIEVMLPFKDDFFKASVNTPINEIKDTRTVAVNINTKVFIGTTTPTIALRNLWFLACQILRIQHI